MSKSAYIETEDGHFIANDDSPEAKVARAYRRKLARLARQEHEDEALALVALALKARQSEDKQP